LFKWFFRIIGLMMLLLLGAVAWWYRDPILHIASRWLGPRRTALPPVADTSVGAPTPGSVNSGRGKLADLARAGGPDSVVLNPNEMASLIGSGIDWTVRRGFDSLRVELSEGTFAVFARLDTRTLPKEALGPLAGLVGTYEPLRIAGPLAIERRGLARWKIRELSLHDFPFPGPTVAQVAKKVAGADADGGIPIIVDPAVARVAVHPTGVVCYRSGRGSEAR
jgi:hypothetical protein